MSVKQESERKLKSGCIGGCDETPKNKGFECSHIAGFQHKEGMPLVKETVSEKEKLNDEYPDQTDTTNAKILLNSVTRQYDLFFFKKKFCFVLNKPLQAFLYLYSFNF